MTTLTEAEVRTMRDEVFEKPSTDSNWGGCRESWMAPASVLWLMEYLDKKKKKMVQQNIKL